MSLWKLSLAFGIIVVQSTDSQCHLKCSTSPLAHLTRPNMSEYSPFPSFPAMAETCWDPIPSTVRPGTLQATWTEPLSFHSSPPLTAEAHLATGCLWRHQEFGGMYGWFCSRIDCKIHLLTYFILVLTRKRLSCFDWEPTLPRMFSWVAYSRTLTSSTLNIEPRLKKVRQASMLDLNRFEGVWFGYDGK